LFIFWHLLDFDLLQSVFAPTVTIFPPIFKYISWVKVTLFYQAVCSVFPSPLLSGVGMVVQIYFYNDLNDAEFEKLDSKYFMLH
jgi:hypothetical protein